MKKSLPTSFIMLMFLCLNISAQVNDSIQIAADEVHEEPKSLTITGTVTTPDGEPIVGAAIVEKGTKNGVAADVNGNYSITVKNNNAILVFSAIGLKTIEEPANRAIINLVMNDEASSLDEVVVIGYGVIDRTKFAGSLSKATSEEIEKDPVASLSQAVQGKMAGVQVTQNSGTPGGGLNFRIRGTNSVSSGNEPLYVIDGIPMNSENYVGIGRDGRQATNILATLNPADIASIEVLKDASATAIYGSRAANGVVMITTKRGTSGTSQISFNSSYGFQQLPSERKYDMVNANEYIEYARAAYENAGRNIPDGLLDNLGNTDWQDEIYRQAPMQNHSISASGGSQNTRYFLSGSYFNQEGIVRNSGFERYSVRANLDHDYSENLKFGVNFNYTNSFRDRVPEDFARSSPVTFALISRPNIPVLNADGTYYIDRVANRDNPVAAAELTIYEDRTDRMIGNVFAEWQIVKGLKARSSFGVDNAFTDAYFYIPNQGIIEGDNKNGYRITNNQETKIWINENTLSYDKDWKNHQLGLLIGNTLQKANITGGTTNATGFASDDVRPIGAATVYTASDYIEGWALASFFSRLNYIFKDRYIATLTYRVDGSSRFGRDNLYANFPSAAFAWRISEEPFMNDVNWISNLKLRASIGSSGNQQIPLYDYLALYGVNADYGNFTGYSPSTLGNPNLGWETTQQTDIGLETGFSINGRERITVILDYFYKRTSGLLLNSPLPRATGFSTILENFGDIENKGWETEISTLNTTGKIRWNTDFNISFVKNKVVNLPGGDVLDGLSDASHIAREGLPLGSFYGYKTHGINPDNGELIYVDIDGDGVVTSETAGVTDPDDRTIIGNPFPDFYGGITNSLFGYNFDFSVQLQFVSGNNVFNFTRRAVETMSNATGITRDSYENYWRNPGDDAKYPKPVSGSLTNAQISDRWVEDGSFLRIRNVTLGYSIPMKALDRVNIDKLRVYTTIQNLFVFTKYSGYDPEVNVYENRGLMPGADYGSYPQARTVLFGVNLTF